MVKAKLYRYKSHPEAYTYTLTKKRKRGKINISCSQTPPPQFGMILCLFRYSTDAGTSSCLWSFNQLLLRLMGEISLSLLCSYSSQGSALDLDPPLCVGHPRASVLCSHWTGLKKQLLRGLWLTQAGVGRGMDTGQACGGRGQRDVAPAWGAVRSTGEVVPGSQDPGRGGLHRLPGGVVWIMTCACAQASWWWQQQP